MLRVGLTGGLGAGKSTVLAMLALHGARVLQSDAVGRELMSPGNAVYQAIVGLFGDGVVLPSGELDRTALGRLAFEGGRVDELNAIVHPAVIARQEELIAAVPRDAIVVIESALIFETQHGGTEGWRRRFDCLVLVTASEAVKIARSLERAGATPETAAALTEQTRRRLAAQMPDEAKIALCDFVVHNDGDRSALATQVDRLWQSLKQLADRI